VNSQARSQPVDPLALLAALEEGVLVVEEGRVRAANPAVSRISGFAPAELLGRRATELFTQANGAPLELPASCEAARLRDAEGALVPVSLRRVDARVCLVIDRSRERRLEQEIWRLGSGGELCAPQLPAASEIAGMIEHEIGTALLLVRGNLRLLLDDRAGTLSEAQRSFAGEARRGAERVARLAGDLLEIAADQAPGVLRVVRKPVRLQALIEAAALEARPLFDERDQRLDLELALECDELRLDPQRIEQLLVNLLANAAKFAPPGSTVRVAAHEFEDDTGPHVCVSVIDEGPGVSVEEAAEIFRPFVRGSSAEQAKASGAGLGLAVCELIARAHGGRVEALVSPGCGHFRLLLPADPEEGRS
jgi:signal transduction histidine kinase